MAVGRFRASFRRSLEVADCLSLSRERWFGDNWAIMEEVLDIGR